MQQGTGAQCLAVHIACAAGGSTAVAVLNLVVCTECSAAPSHHAHTFLQSCLRATGTFSCFRGLFIQLPYLDKLRLPAATRCAPRLSRVATAWQQHPTEAAASGPPATGACRTASIHPPAVEPCVQIGLPPCAWGGRAWTWLLFAPSTLAGVLFCIVALVTFADLAQVQYEQTAGMCR